MSREQRRRLLLRAHAAAGRFCKKAEADPYFRPATDAFVAGWLLGYRARRKDAGQEFADFLKQVGPGPFGDPHKNESTD